MKDLNENPRTWGPIGTILGTVGIYFGGQYLAVVVLVIIGVLAGLKEADIVQFQKSVYVQATFVMLAGVFSLLAIRQLLKLKKTTLDRLGLQRKPKSSDAGVALIGYAIYFGLLLIALLVIKTLIPSLDIDQEQVVGFEPARLLVPLVLTFFSIVIVPAVVEEIIARGFLYSGLRKKLSLVPAVILTSSLFALPHLQFDSDKPLLWVAAIDTFILSVVLIGLREKTGSIWACIIVHFIKNSLAFVFVFLVGA